MFNKQTADLLIAEKLQDAHDRIKELQAQLAKVRYEMDYFHECSQSGFVTIKNPYTHCRERLQQALDTPPQGDEL